jgi:hypothetical protein
MLTENEASCQLNRRGIIEIFEDIGEYMNKIEGIVWRLHTRKQDQNSHSNVPLRLA